MSTNQKYFYIIIFTFDVDQSVKQSDWSDSKQVGEIPHADLERIPVVEVEVSVDL